MTFLDAAAHAVETFAEEFAGLGEEIAREIAQYGRSRIPVESSAITALTYHGDRTLTIEFSDGRLYAIPDFPALELSRWLNAGSIGAYFNANVRGRY